MNILLLAMLFGSDVMVLEVGGNPFQIVNKNSITIRAGDKIAFGAKVYNSTEPMTIHFFKEGFSEVIKADKTVTVEDTGCSPADAVTRIKKRTVSEGLRKRLKPLIGERGGVAVGRRDVTKNVKGDMISPAHTEVTSRIPTFKWNALKDVKSYLVRISKDRRVVLEMITPTNKATSDLRLPFGKYEWNVYATIKNDTLEKVVTNAVFIVETGTIAREVAHLEKSKTPADWLLAATFYDASGHYTLALKQYEKYHETDTKNLNVLNAMKDIYKLSFDKTNLKKISDLIEKAKP